MKDLFSKSNLKILRDISYLSPDSSIFLEVRELTDIFIVLQCDIVSLSNEIQVLKPMLKQSKSKDIVDLSFEVLPFDQAFSKIIYLAIGALTIPVCATTTERTFRKRNQSKLVHILVCRMIRETRISSY